MNKINFREIFDFKDIMKKVLIVEDHRHTKEMFLRKLENTGFEVQTAETGQEAFDKAAVFYPDIILLDYYLPDFNGREVIKKLREMNLHFPFIVITAIDEVHTAVEMMKMGASDYLVKDRQLIELIPSQIHKVLKQKANVRKLKHSDDYLLESNRRFYDLFQNSIDPVFYIDKKGDFIEFNNAFKNIFEFDNRDTLTQSFKTFFENEDEFNLLMEDLQNRQIKNRLVTLKTSSNKKIECTLNIIPRQDSGDDFYDYLVIAHKSEKEAYPYGKSDLDENFAKSIIEIAQSIVLVLNKEGKILHYNTYLEGLTGKPLSETSGSDWFDTFIEKDKSRELREFFHKTLQENKVESMVNPIVAKNGEKIDIQWYDRVLKNEEGESVGLLAIGHNITERTRYEEELNRSRRQMESVFDGIPDLIFHLSPDFKVSRTNKAAADLKPDSEGRDIFDVLPQLNDISMFLHNVQTKRERQKTEIKSQSLSRQLKDNFWEVTAVPLMQSEGCGIVLILRNITESKLAGQTKSLLASIVESSEDAIIGLSLEGEILSWNLGAEKTYGYSQSEIIGRHISLIVPKDRHTAIEKTLERVKNKEIIERYEAYHIKKNGERIFVSLTVSYFEDAQNNAVGVSVISRDITKSKKAEKALQESKTRFKELYDNMSSGVIFYEAALNGEDFIIKDMNPAAEKIEKLSKSELIHKRLSEIVPKDLNKGLFDIYKQVWQSGEPQEYLFTFYQDADKISGWRKNYIYKLPSGEIVSIFDDTSEKIASEEALKESEERYRGFVQNFKGIAFRWTVDYIPLLFHGSVKEITGYQEEDFTQKRIKWGDIIHPKDMESIKAQSELVGIMPNYEHDFEYRIIRRDGETVWVHEHLQNICDEDGNLQYIQGTIYNITERKKAEFDLKRSQEQLRNLAMHLETAREEEKKRIALEIHDELGHALTALKLDLAWLLKKKFLRREALLDKIRTMYEIIESTIRKVRLISTELRPSVLDHFGLVAAIEWQAKEFQKRTACRTRLTISPQEINADEYRKTALFRIFQEILTNVARHANASRVDVNLEMKNGTLELKVSDNGKGIKQEQIKDVKSFGLIGMYERTNAMGGHLTISGISGIGTTVTVKIPMEE